MFVKQAFIGSEILYIFLKFFDLFNLFDLSNFRLSVLNSIILIRFVFLLVKLYHISFKYVTFYLFIYEI